MTQALCTNLLDRCLPEHSSGEVDVSPPYGETDHFLRKLIHFWHNIGAAEEGEEVTQRLFSASFKDQRGLILYLRSHGRL